MPMYTYRREDGTTFEIRQKFLDDPLTVDPETGQKVVRVVQPAGIIFKGSGFYVNDSKNASNSAVNGKVRSSSETETKIDAKTETKKEAGKSETKTENKKELAGAAD